MRTIAWAGHHLVKTTFRFGKTEAPPAPDEPEPSSDEIKEGIQALEEHANGAKFSGWSWLA